MSRAIVQIGPGDAGKRMRLEDFDHAEGQEGHLYELSRGVITVMDVPDRKHLAQLNAARRQFSAFDLSHPGSIHTIAGGGECKILLSSEESERHPDLAIYLKESTAADDEEFWATWVPEIAVEIVSRGSRQRDYVEKREEYLKFGVREYWIIDAESEEMLVLRRSGSRWIERVIGADQTYRTKLLAGFDFEMGPVFDAARKAK
ncbi:MAG TPA: Uma2 family endonuclease [Tepidisphaeraceae bacterium]|nr:Uma2 family endonuclease [Tepidisphaeraceae bacterium]